MAKYRERFNDKARAGGVAKQRLLKAKRQKQFRQEASNELGAATETVAAPTTNENLLPLTSAEKEQRKRKLFETLTSAQDAKVDKAKKKRLEKYIDRQVKREERDEILAKLSKTQFQTPQLQSLSRLGSTAQVNRSIAANAASSEGSSNDESDSGSERPASTIIDRRPPQGGFASGFTFSATSAKPSKQIKKPSWRERLGLPEEEEEEEEDSAEEVEESNSEDEPHTNSMDNSELSSSGSESDSDSGADHDSDQQSADDGIADEWQGFSDSGKSSDDPMDGNDKSKEETGASEGKSFVQWAKSVEHKEESIPTPKAPESYVHEHRPLDNEKLDAELPGKVPRQELEYVQVQRTAEINEVRSKLPALACEQQIMEAIHHYDVVVVTGETGSGKTTQVPQFLYENGYASKGMIGVTQPRRVAAVSMAKRISVEMGEKSHGKNVGYQIRFDTKVGSETKIKLMTDGVLLRELASDLRLEKYSAIVIDEAHERSVNTDILVGVLSRVGRLRREEGTNPLKLIIMSATLRVKDFTQNARLFSTPPPVVSVEARQFPVQVHFNRRTKHDYVSEAIAKARKIHTRLPKGGILIFLTGQNEISQAVRELRDGKSDEEVPLQVNSNPKETVIEEEEVDLDYNNIDEDGSDDYDDDVDGSDMSDGEEEGFDEEYDGEETKLHVLPLYSLLPTAQQMRVFAEVPRGHRLCVVATNVAETSLTIPGIKYVVDAGRAKQRLYDNLTGVQKFRVEWISKAAADQRAGRAGRTGPGHCYRLYSSAVYERDFPQFSEPEILRMPIEGLVLQMKAMGIHHIVNFPFPTAPSTENLTRGLKTLSYLGALKNEELTQLGQQMSMFPLHPRHAKMLLIGNQHDCLPFVIAVVAAMSVGDPWVPEQEVDSKRKGDYHKAIAQFSALDPRADCLRLLACAAAYSHQSTQEFCEQMFLRHKAMAETDSLRGQLARIVANITRPDAPTTVAKSLSGRLSVPSAVQVAALKQIIAAGYIDQVATRSDIVEDSVKPKHMAITRVPYVSLAKSNTEHVFIHPTSVLATLGSEPPGYLVYSALTVSLSSDDDEDKEPIVRMRPLVDVSANALSRIAWGTPLMTLSKPLGGAFAPKQSEPNKREAWVVPRLGAAIGTGGVGWDLPAKKVTQIRKRGEWQVV